MNDIIKYLIEGAAVVGTAYVAVALFRGVKRIVAVVDDAVTQAHHRRTEERAAALEALTASNPQKRFERSATAPARKRLPKETLLEMVQEYDELLGNEEELAAKYGVSPYTVTRYVRVWLGLIEPYNAKARWIVEKKRRMEAA